MGSPVEKAFSTTCPITGSRVFIRNELLELTDPIEVVCPVCDHWHVWNPATLSLTEPDDIGDKVARRSSN